MRFVPGYGGMGVVLGVPIVMVPLAPGYDVACFLIVLVVFLAVVVVSRLGLIPGYGVGGVGVGYAGRRGDSNERDNGNSVLHCKM